MAASGLVCKARIAGQDVMKRFELKHPYAFLELESQIIARFQLGPHDASVARFSYTDSNGNNISIQNDEQLQGASKCVSTGNEPFLLVSVVIDSSLKKDTSDCGRTKSVKDENTKGTGSWPKCSGLIWEASKALDSDDEVYEMLGSSGCGLEGSSLDTSVLAFGNGEDNCVQNVHPSKNGSFDSTDHPKSLSTEGSKAKGQRDQEVVSQGDYSDEEDKSETSICSLDEEEFSEVASSTASTPSKKQDVNEILHSASNSESAPRSEGPMERVLLAGAFICLLVLLPCCYRLARGSSNTELVRLLNNHHLEDVSFEVCNKLGLKKPAHLEYVTEKDVDELHLKPIQRNALIKLVSQIKSEKNSSVVLSPQEIAARDAQEAAAREQRREEEEMLMRDRKRMRIVDLLASSPAELLADEDGVHAKFPKFQFMVFGVVGAGKSTTLHWLCRHGGTADEKCRQFAFRHYGDHTHTTKLVGTSMNKVKVFDTAGLSDLHRSKAFGIKVLASGYQKESCDILYVDKPEPTYILYPDTFAQARKCMHDEPHPQTMAHAVLLVVKYTEDMDEIERTSEFISELRADDESFWTVRGIEPVVAVTHLHGCKRSGGIDECLTLLSRRLSLSSEDVFPLVPAGADECRLYGYGALCGRANLNFIAPDQYEPVLQALKSKALMTYKREPERAGMNWSMPTVQGDRLLLALKSKAMSVQNWVLDRVEELR